MTGDEGARASNVEGRIEKAYDALPNSLDNPHLAQQVARLMPVLGLVLGTRGCPTEDEARRTVVELIEALRARPEAPVARHGAIAVSRSLSNSGENFEVFVMSAEVFGFQVWVHGQAQQRERETSS